MTKYVAIAKQVGRGMRVYGIFRSHLDAVDYAERADPINATWHVCAIIEEENAEVKMLSDKEPSK